MNHVQQKSDIQTKCSFLQQQKTGSTDLKSNAVTNGNSRWLKVQSERAFRGSIRIREWLQATMASFVGH